MSSVRHVFDIPLGAFIGLVALAGLFIGNWLTLLTYRLPRMMEREWQAQCLDAVGKARGLGGDGGDQAGGTARDILQS